MDAQEKYICLVNKLLKDENVHLNDKNQSEHKASRETAINEKNKYKDIITSIECGNVFKITLNRPKKFNAFSKEVKKQIPFQCFKILFK